MKAVSHRGSTIGPSQDEKDACERELRRHHERGRLDERDLILRVDLARRAATRGELRRLLADLPDDRRLLRMPLVFRR